MNVCVVGLGYIGLPTALLLAKAGNSVAGYDVVRQKIDMLDSGRLPFEEAGLRELFVSAGDNFHAVSALVEADVYIVAVPTPVTADKLCDLGYVESAMRSLIPFIRKGVLVVLESTVRPGTTVGVVKPILEESGLRAGVDFSIAYVAEKAIPGNTLYEMVHNDRIIGRFDEAGAERARQLYSSFVKGNLLVADCTVVETVKLVENAYRDVNIAFANELAVICAKRGMDVWEVIRLANRHPRVNVHQPGPGVGGHCIAIDPWFLVEGFSDTLVSAARSVNDSMPAYVVSVVDSMLKSKKGKVAVLGAAYKKNVDDARESPSERLAVLFREKGYEVSVTDPYVKVFPEVLVGFEDAVDGAAAVVVAVDHDCYREKEALLSSLEKKGVLVFDARNLFNGRFKTIGRDGYA